jgi:hypothetical protein
MQLLEHPVPVYALLFGVVEDVNLPEREQKLTDDRIVHSKYPNAMRSRRRLVITRPYLGARAQFVGAVPRDFIAGFQVSEHFHERP